MDSTAPSGSPSVIPGKTHMVQLAMKKKSLSLASGATLTLDTTGLAMSPIATGTKGAFSFDEGACASPTAGGGSPSAYGRRPGTTPKAAASAAATTAKTMVDRLNEVADRDRERKLVASQVVRPTSAGRSRPPLVLSPSASLTRTASSGTAAFGGSPVVGSPSAGRRASPSAGGAGDGLGSSASTPTLIRTSSGTLSAGIAGVGMAPQARPRSPSPAREKGHIAGYAGHVPGYEHVAGGRTFTKATQKALSRDPVSLVLSEYVPSSPTNNSKIKGGEDTRGHIMGYAGHVPDYKDKHGASFKRLTADRDLAAEGGLLGQNARKTITYKSVGLIARGATPSAAPGVGAL